MPQRKLIAEIQEHFAKRGWQPLLPMKIGGLQSLSVDELQLLVEHIKAATDRFAAISEVLAAIKPYDHKN